MLRELGKLFGSENKVRLLRFFLANQDVQISFLDLVKKVKIKPVPLKKEIKLLVSINFLNELSIINEEPVKLKSGKIKNKKNVQDGFELNKGFELRESLANLVLDFRFINREELLNDVKKCGKIKLLCMGGVFKQFEEGQIDLLIAGDAIDKDKLEDLIKKLEADYGTELRYAVFESEEFRYRVNMFDRLLKDFFKGPHEKVLEKISTRP